MTGGRLSAVIREAVASATAQRAASVLTIAIIGGMCAAVLLTSGRAAGAQRAVLETFDAAGTRMIVVRADGDAGLDPGVLGRLAAVDGIAWAGAFGPAEDIANARVPDGARAPMRAVWSDDLPAAGLPSRAGRGGPGGVWASPAALDRLGLPGAAGAVRTADGFEHAVLGRIDAPAFLGFLEPLVLAPRSRTAPGPVAVLVVVAAHPSLVGALTDVVIGLLGVDDPSTVQVTTSEQLATLRAAVEARLGAGGRALVLGILALTGVLVAAVLQTLVVLRRKDFGRRRALGATRGLIVALLLVQTGILAATGAVLGSLAGLAVLAAGGDPAPGAPYVAALGVIAVAVALAAAMPPAIVASRRDPITELRVP